MKLKIKNPGKKLYQIRTEKNYTQGCIASALGVSGKTVSNWENGKTMMGIEQINRVAEFLEVSPIDLIEIKEGELV